MYMEAYNVKISPAAQSDFLDIASQFSSLEPEEAMHSFDSFVGKVRKLKTAPESCPLVKDMQLRLRGYRLLQVEDHVIFYVIVGGAVLIRRILYARRQYDRLV